MFICEERALILRHQGETLRIETWGRDALRIRATMYPRFTGDNHALSEKTEVLAAKIRISEDESEASIRNGRIMVTVNRQGVMKFFRDDQVIFQ